MKIEQIFSKKLTRDINGVVKAEQKDNDSVYVELDEYVVTRELDRHFRAFFEAYVPSVEKSHGDMSGKIGVWISGFFGSGKSHFLKILSYLLENKSVEKDGQGRQAFEFFKDKINDAMLLADIQKAVTKDTDVILFNIDSRANTDDRENAILKVFLKVFNERVGYCADFPHIAHLERELDKRNQYASFKDKFAELTQSTWEKERDAYDFYRDELSEALAHASEQSLESAKAWVEQVENNFPLDIRNFCKWVNEYLDRTGDRNLLFLVDEVGQFIGKNTQMMLKLQTITEDLGTFVVAELGSLLPLRQTLMLPLVVWISAMARTSLKFKGVLVPAYSCRARIPRKLFKSDCCPKRKKLVHTSSMSLLKRATFFVTS